ncbi:glycoside hydrolase family 65 protein [Trujillonella endophytica]|uniref:Trehalose and maltose hydrolase (Possible phosphorylase) n=1 Tax=Trujillonella endophytica TaxID=673521 RepID=A0A1H8SZD5_9ACTN|nr:glycosyl hydrolase family 65 protein [Trujillella endophytica]SEO84239.1 Trehalose and maltose hydrolase (possible phosphorylase) [Trujillella endophytica]
MTSSPAESADSDWVLRYEGADPGREAVREVLCAVGNGRFVTRGAAPESRADGVHYPGTYAAGVVDRCADRVDGRAVENESIVNLPDWQPLTFRIDDGDWLGDAALTAGDQVQELDLRRGVLTRRFVVTDGAGRRSRVAQRRLVSMADPMLAALDCSVVPENWSGRLTVRSALDGRVENAGVARYRGLDGRHLAFVTGGHCAGLLTLVVETVQSRIRVGLAARHRLLVDGVEHEPGHRATAGDGLTAVEFDVDVRPGRAVTVEKVVALCTSRDRAIGEPGAAALDEARRAPSFDRLLERHVQAWAHLWERCDVRIEGPSRTSLVLRLHVFHILQTVSPHSVDLDAGIPARGLHGEAYRGHVFWDEVFVLPFLVLRLPSVARAMLMYRWRRLPQARAAARAAGHRGALFPWQSGATGREESPTVHLNPRSGRWVPDNSALQRHIGLAVAYNTWRYHEATGDTEFLVEHGAELLLDVASFWADLATYDRTDDRYDLCGVMGPDEYHDALPGRDGPGLDDNAYTNVMAAWTLTRALECVAELPARRREHLLDRLGIGERDLLRWEHVSRRLRLCWHPDGVLSQFRGYADLAEFDWAGYRARYGDISRLDRILEAEGDTPNRYRVSKQADVLMLFHLLTADEFYAVLDRLGYAHDRRTIPTTVAYYTARTCHGSTLSRVVQAWVLARSDRARAWAYFQQALESDIADLQGGTTGEGIHLGAMAGTVDLLQRGFTGLQTHGGALGFDPYLPERLTGMRFRLHYRQHPELDVAITHRTLTVGDSAQVVPELPVRVRDADFRLDPRGTLQVPLQRRRG